MAAALQNVEYGDDCAFDAAISAREYISRILTESDENTVYRSADEVWARQDKRAKELYGRDAI